MNPQDPPKPDAKGEEPEIDFGALSSVRLSQSPLSSAMALPRFKLVREIGMSAGRPVARPLLALTVDGGGIVGALEAAADDCFRLRRFDAAGVELPGASFTKGSRESELRGPTRIVIDAGGQLYILDSAADVLKKFSPDGRWLATFSSAGPEGMELNGLRDVDVDGQGNIYLADSNNDRIVQLLPDGELGWVLDRFPGRQADEEDELYEPASVCVSADGAVLVADSNNNRVVGFGADRRPQLIIDGGCFRFPTRVRVSRKGDSIYVADIDYRVQRFNSRGEKTGELRLTAARSGEADAVGDVDFAIDGESHVVAAMALRGSIQVLDFPEPAS